MTDLNAEIAGSDGFKMPDSDIELPEMMMLKCLILAIKYLKIVIFSWHCLWELV